RQRSRASSAAGVIARPPRSTSAVLLLADLVLLELLVQVRARGADGGGGRGDVPGVLLELAHQERSLGGLLEVAERPRGRRRRRLLTRPPQHLPEVLGADFVVLDHDEQALHRVLELADVAAPGMALQGVERRGGERGLAEVV